MAKFLSPLVASLISTNLGGKRGMWKLHEPLLYHSDVAGRIITVPEGFETDFESCPRLPFVYWFFGDISDESATLHDYLYRSGLVSREMADKVFLEAMDSRGVSLWRRYGIFLGVRVGGWMFYKKGINVE